MNIRKSILTTMVLGALAFTGATVQPAQAAIGFDVPAPAENLEKPASVTTQHHINVDGKVIEPVEGKQNVIYVDGQPLVALRQTAEALGYTVTWDQPTKTALIDMSIATLAVQPDVAQVIRKGKLQIINLDTSESMLPMPRFVDGQLFVSPKAFELLLNEVKITRDEIFIAPQRAQLASTSKTTNTYHTNDIDTFLPPSESSVKPVVTADTKKANEPLIKIKRTEKTDK